MLTALPLAQRTGWTTSDKRINYSRVGTDWAVTPRSPSKGGLINDKQVMMAAGLINANNDPLLLFPSRREAVEALATAFSWAGVSAPVTDMLMRTLAYEVGGLGEHQLVGSGIPVRVTKAEGDVWRLTGNIMKLACVQATIPAHDDSNWVERKRQLKQLESSWRQLLKQTYPTRKAALKGLDEWLAAVGIKVG